jgi:acyl-coenzyme A thioesterase PaaI-like protein
MELVDRLNESMLPFGATLGIRFTSADKDRLVAELIVREEICTRPPVLHGGATGTTTIESKTNFLGPAPVGTKVIGECTPIHRGRRTQVWQTRITTEAGKLVALVTQTQMVL